MASDFSPHSNHFIHPVFVFSVGLCAMVVAGYILIQGMLQFSGNETTRDLLIAAGIVFQVTEALCFVAAAALINKSRYWRFGLLCLGILLFAFSSAVMTLAQKTTLETGEIKDKAIVSQITGMESQIESLSNVIAGYKHNAEKQSQSIYANSRQLGQDSLNRAVDLENKKIQLLNEVSKLKESRRQTSSVFFKQIETITGLPALETEFYFLVIRSVLLELCGIVLMAFAAYLRSSTLLWKHEHTRPSATINPHQQLTLYTPSAAEKKASSDAALTQSNPDNAKPLKRSHKKIVSKSPSKNTDSMVNPDDETNLASSWAAKYIDALRKQQGSNYESVELGNDFNEPSLDNYFDKLTTLHEEKKLISFKMVHIKEALKKYYDHTINDNTAAILQRMAKKHFKT